MNNPFISAGFLKVKKENQKIAVKIYNKKTSEEELLNYDFETNIVYDIPNTDIKFAIALGSNNNYITFMVNIGFNPFNHSVSSPFRTWYPQLVPSVFETLTTYGFDYSKNEILKIDTDDIYYLEVSVIKL